MPSWLICALRTTVQAGWGWLVVWAAGLGVDVPAAAPAWVQGAALAVATMLVTVVLRWLESQPGLGRRFARWLMLGVQRRPVYPVV
jgi:hypothetical protein